MAIDSSGGLSVGQRLDRIEGDLKEVLRRLDVYATEADVRELKGKVDHIADVGSRHAQDALALAEKVDGRVRTLEGAYVDRTALRTLAAFLIVQFLVIIGLGLGLVYELLKR